MRTWKKHGPLGVTAVAGTYVVTLGFDLAEAACDGFLGFAIHRTDHEENEAYYLEGMKCFAETDPGFPAGTRYPTNEQPIQSFQWADYSAKPGYRYTYTVTALKGSPAALSPLAEVAVEVTTESPKGGDHDVYFNCGVSASQAYVERFGNRRPEDVQNGQAWIWLSRGLYEALIAFVADAVPGTHALRVAAYEFHYEPFLKVLKDAINRGVDIEIVYDARKAKPGQVSRDAIASVDQAGGVALADHCAERQTHPSYISHNKFIVKLKNGAPVSVWTGGTNFSDGGIFGHSNVAHVVEDSDVADLYLRYWTALHDDPPSSALKGTTEDVSPLPAIPPSIGTNVIFSPRSDLTALQWYADVAMSAREGVFMTFAFGMHDLFKDVYRNSAASFRLALLEKATRPLKKDSPERKAEEKAIQVLRNMPQNTFAIGSLIATNKIDGWVKERLLGLNSNVKYVHNKFMLVDPMSDRPIVIAGSANFSNASTKQNDENMLVVVGNTRVADIYLGEFMRLYSHHAFRESLKWRSADDPPKPLRTDDWWSDYFGDAERSARRQFFARRF
ncbi:phospholipase D-like domain-containing protein [Aquibium sp. ELW1220]|uniref:phospholipase D-like domain-containing protein n=1 Tax=Aquibium sp. ELW1220 TaxID=2976766 RepID=UPI0025B0AFD3|nr:phospholipase D-like domain-containing protein [Aquibium sp. ELW1220]MDN2583769.1 phospholipase D-like domain-containing protein [Aquibium sp. ELW1220]